MITAGTTTTAGPSGSNGDSGDSGDSGDLTVPVFEETATVEKRRVSSGTARVRITVSEHDEMVQALLSRQDVTIDRVQVGRVVDVAPPTRQDGDTMVIPILEEVVVTEKKLLLREELHIRITQTTQTHTEPVRLRREIVEIDQAVASPPIERIS